MLLIGGLSGLIVLGLGGLAAAYAMLQRQSVPIHQLLPADTQLYATLTLGSSTLPHIETLRRAFPEVVNYRDDPVTAHDLATLLGVDMTTDVVPWVGAEAAVALWGLPLDTLETLGDVPDLLAQTDGSQVVILVAARDRSGARAFLDKQRSYRERQGATFGRIEANGVTIYAEEQARRSPLSAFALLHGYVVFANDAEAIAEMAAREPRGDDTLSASPHFTAVLAELPADRLGFLYMPGPAATALLRAAGQGLSNVPGACLCVQQIVSLADRVETMHGAGLSLTVQDAGLRLDLTTVLDKALLSEENFAALTAQVEPVDPARTGELSSAALGVWSMRFPDDFGARYLAFLEGTPGAPEQLETVEEVLGADLETDLFAWMRGEAVVAYFPGDEQTTTTFALRIQVSDRQAAEGGLRRIFTGLARANGMPDGPIPVQIGANVYDVVETEAGRIGYSVNGDEVVIALGEPALRAMSAAGPMLMDDAGYQAAVAALPAPNGGIIFLEMGELRALLEAVDDTAAAAAARLAPFQALVAAGALGTDPEGVARASLILVLAEE